MIITKTPLRISFAGGGSDLPSFCSSEPGCVVSATIQKYIYVAVHNFFNHNQYCLKYFASEIADSADSIRHPIIREAVKLCSVGPGVEIVSMADSPAGCGLGSSGSFTVGLLSALRLHNFQHATTEWLARSACNIEINQLGEPIGKQDQYASAFGGLNCISFLSDSVNVNPIQLPKELLGRLASSLFMFRVGSPRSAASVLRSQDASMQDPSARVFVTKMAALAKRLASDLLRGNLSDFGAILDESWRLKRALHSGISNFHLNMLYDSAKSAGAEGGKLLGAGGSGYLLIYCPDASRQLAVMNALSELTPEAVFFDASGSSVVFNSNGK
jgi:D-glycero-alpha-D-manno-heptose-7-phosphate kinase